MKEQDIEKSDSIPVFDKIEYLKFSCDGDQGCMDRKLRRATKLGLIRPAVRALINNNMDPNPTSGVVSPAIMDMLSDSMTIKASNTNLASYAQSKDLDIVDIREDAQKAKSLIDSTFELDPDLDIDLFEAIQYSMIQNKDGIKGEDWFKSVIEKQYHVVSNPANSSYNIPISIYNINNYTDANGNKMDLGFEKQDAEVIVQSLHETFTGTVVREWEKAIDLYKEGGEGWSKATDRQKELVKQTEFKVKTIEDIQTGGSNYNAYLYPSSDGKGLTFKIYGLGENTFDVKGFELTSISSAYVIPWSNVQKMMISRSIHSYAGDILENWESLGDSHLESMIAMRDEFRDIYIEPSTGKLKKDNKLKTRRSGINNFWAGEPTRPETVLGFLSSFALDWKGNWERVAELSGDTPFVGATAEFMAKHWPTWLQTPGFEGQVRTRGPFEFMEEVNLIESLWGSGSRIGKIEYDWIQSVFGDMPLDTPASEIRKILKKEMDKHELDFKEIHEDFRLNLEMMGQSLNQVARGVGRMGVNFRRKKLGIPDEPEVLRKQKEALDFSGISGDLPSAL